MANQSGECPNIDTSNFKTKFYLEQNQILFDGLKKRLNINCPNSIPKTILELNKIINNINLMNKYFKNKLNLKKNLLIFLIIFIIICIICLFKLFQK